MTQRQPLDCAPAPCGSCPYRRDTPPGVWDASEYEKLRHFGFDPEAGIPPTIAVFLCHQTHLLGRETVCRGWLTVEQDSPAVRLALSRGEVTAAQVYAPALVPLYATGDEAADAGLAAVERPPLAARRLATRLHRKGVGRQASEVTR